MVLTHVCSRCGITALWLELRQYINLVLVQVLLISHLLVVVRSGFVCYVVSLWRQTSNGFRVVFLTPNLFSKPGKILREEFRRTSEKSVYLHFFTKNQIQSHSYYTKFESILLPISPPNCHHSIVYFFRNLLYGTSHLLDSKPFTIFVKKQKITERTLRETTREQIDSTSMTLAK